MVRRGKRWLSVLLVALLAFAQASVAFAGCFMQRSEMAEMAAPSDSPGTCHDSAGYASTGVPMPASGCLAHCTMDLQAVGQPLDTSQAPAAALIFYPPRIASPSVALPRPATVPPKSIPARILLHSFLI